jgi:hypothetical protein
VEVGHPREVLLLEPGAERLKKSLARMQALVFGPESFDVARRRLGAAGGVERGELAEIPVGGCAGHPLVRELDNHHRRVRAKQRGDLRDGTVQIVNVME